MLPVQVLLPLAYRRLSCKCCPGSEGDTEVLIQVSNASIRHSSGKKAITCAELYVCMRSCFTKSSAESKLTHWCHSHDLAMMVTTETGVISAMAIPEGTA